MKNYKKICLLFLFSAFFIFILSGLSLAQKGLETQYPQIPGVEAPTTIKTPLPQYVKYIFNFGIWIAGFVAFASMVYGGVRYLTSVGDPSKTGDARDQIFAGILGLVILLSSYLILSNLNPQLLTLKVNTENLAAPGEAIGVYLCKDSSMKDCTTYISNSDSLAPSINDKVTYIHFQNSDNAVFGAVLHENNSRQGTCKVFLSDGSVQLPAGDASSITVFRQSTTSLGEGVTLYKNSGFQESIGGPFKYVYPVKNYNDLGMIEKVGRSIKIIDDREYLAVIFDRENGEGKCEVFDTGSDSDLNTNPIGTCACNKFNPLTYNQCGCLTSLIILPVKR